MFKLTKVAIFAIAIAFLTGCETPTTQRYAISADTNITLKATGIKDVAITNFTPPANLDITCRAFGPLKVADNLTHTQYIQKAFEDELKVAGAYGATKPKVTLSGQVNRLDVSSSKSITNGHWQIDLTINSSNGKSLSVSEYYEFSTGFVATEACRNTADAFYRAVQNLVGNTFKNPGFIALTR